MPDFHGDLDARLWVIWNGSSGMLATAMLGRVELVGDNWHAWLASPFDMVGPLNLSELESKGRVPFAACIVMSRERWQSDQSELRQASFDARRAARAQHAQSHARFGWRERGRRASEHGADELRHREVLNLPMAGALEPAQVKVAYRRLAQRAHPDMGGSHDRFIAITEARDALLASIG
ncbi:MAG TPA: J domain-containing protein [Aquabacterium sp.]|uniref:J domain-containing protein n=1 Tax=Aquabacterium sp. TaxID=1872578 RepID=UPI002E32D8A1|nr:J domain-containing protein [Aquabacterium sp.]HEX5355314.1 J domain-containing protein [Aquabacterium sp.]